MIFLLARYNANAIQCISKKGLFFTIRILLKQILLAKNSFYYFLFEQSTRISSEVQFLIVLAKISREIFEGSNGKRQKSSKIKAFGVTETFPTGFEPMAFCLGGRRSILLSYGNLLNC